MWSRVGSIRAHSIENRELSTPSAAARPTPSRARLGARRTRARPERRRGCCCSRASSRARKRRAERASRRASCRKSPILPSFAMAKETPYQVLVRDLPTHRRFEVPAERVAEWLKGLPVRDALGAPDPDPQAGHGTADLDLYADGAHVFAAGTFHGEATVACSRCVNPVTLHIDEPLRVTFLPRH